MDVDVANLIVATLALAGTVVAIAYQYRRDQSAALPVLYLHCDNGMGADGTRFVLRSSAVGDGSWRVASMEVVEPPGVLLRHHGDPQRRILFHPPLPISPGIVALAAEIPASVPLQHLHVRTRVMLRSSSGRRAKAYAEGWYG